MKKLPMVYALKTIFLVCVFLSPTSISWAAVTYQYAGNNYTNFFPSGASLYDGSMSVTASFTVNSPLIDFNGDLSALVTNYTLNDGIHTITESDGFIQGFVMSTDSLGNPVLWDILVNSRDYGDPSLVVGDQITNIRTRQSLSSFEDFPQVYQCTFKVAGNCTFDLLSDAFTTTVGSWSIVPIPSAVWLFGSGLLGLVGTAMHRRST